MNKWICYIKSHGEGPDFEREVQAKTKAEAAIKIHRLLPLESKAEWSPKELLSFINEDK